MTTFISKIIGRFGYVIYFFIIALALLYFRFPSEKMSDYFQMKMENLFPSHDFTVMKTSIAAPLALRLHGVEVSSREKPDLAVFTATNIVLSPVIRSLFKKGIELDIKCKAYDGHIKGTMHMQNSEASQINSILNFEDLDLEKESHIKELLGDSILGNLSGRIQLTGNYNDLMNSSGEADIHMNNIELAMTKPVLGLNVLNLDLASLKISFKNRRANINNGNFKSEILSGTISGNIQLRDELGDSILALKGTLEPFAGFLKGLESSGDIANSVRGSLKRGNIPFAIKGTFKDYKVVI